MSRASPHRSRTSGSVPSSSLRERELEAAREIAHAFLNASQPVEVYRLALVRVTPLVQASFSSVFLRDPGDPMLLRLVCAQNWPQASARYLGQMRIRVGRGPTGRAVAEAQAVEAEDVFADPSLREWWDPARELGFASLIALPLKVRDEVAGALSFYFETPRRFSEDERELLMLVADQLAATAEKARLIESLQRSNEQLRRQNEELTERVREAEEAQRLKNEFLSNISHEFRTPLTSILSYAYLLSKVPGTSLPESQSAAVARIERAATVLLGLVTDLLDLSQLKLGRLQPAWAAEDAVTLARRAAEAVGPPPADITFEIRAPEGPLRIETDAEKVLKILENLLSNAFKFMSRGQARLTVRRVVEDGAVREDGLRTLPDPEDVHEQSAPPREWIEWEVEDTGIGIRPEDIAAIFDEFRQVDGSSTRLYGGTGLGLALSLRLARLLGGDILVESEPSKGSTFLLRLPASRPASS